MAITTMDQLAAAIAAGITSPTYDASITAQGPGFFCSLWTAGGHPGAGATPATGVGAVPTNATAGAIYYVNPTGINIGYLGSWSASATTIGTLILYDRLVHTSGLSGIVTSAQTVNSTAITRTYDSGNAVEAWLEWYTATGATACTATIAYTNQSGTSSRSGTASIAASTKAACMIPISLQSGDTGVQSVQSVTLSGTTGTAGNFGITMCQRLAQMQVVIAGTGVAVNWGQLGLPIIANNACLAYKVLASTTSTGIWMNTLSFIQG